MSAGKPLTWDERATRYLGEVVNYFTWPSLHHKLTPAQWQRLQHKGRRHGMYYQHAPGKGRATPRQRRRKALGGEAGRD